MKSRHLNPRRTAALFALAFGIGLGAGAARADERGLQPQQMLPQYRQECAACHLAYPPGMLPARSWNRIMGGLERHYGTDASLDAATVAQIGQWLESNAGRYRRVSEAPPDDRITRSAWFERKHRELDATVWRLASVRSAAVAGGAVGRAEQGRFGEHELRLPAGLPDRLRRAFED